MNWNEGKAQAQPTLAMFFRKLINFLKAFFAGKKSQRSNTYFGEKIGKTIPEPASGLLGHLPLLTKGQNNCAYDSLSKIRKEFGDVCQVRILGKPWVLISDAELIQKILVSDREHFPKKGDAVDEMKVLFGDQGILVTEGEQWLRQRKMCMPAFRHEQLLAMTDGMNSVALQAIKHLKGKNEIESLSFMNRVAFSSICISAFDHNINALESNSHDPILVAQELATKELIKRIQRTKYWKSLPIPSNFHLANALKEQETALKQIINEKSEGAGEAKILLNEFLRARDDNGNPMSETELFHMCMQFMAAGHETTGAALQWVLYFLATHPDVQERVLKEANEILGDRENISFDDVKKMTYFEAVFNESMRVRAPIPVMVRSAASSIVLGDYLVEEGSVILIMVGEVQRDPRYWGSDANFFNPEHFTHQNEAARPRAAFMPFGLGPRLCIGHRFTVLEACILVVQLIRKYRFEYISGQNVEPFLRTTWSTKNGIRLSVSPRN